MPIVNEFSENTLNSDKIPNRIILTYKSNNPNDFPIKYRNCFKSLLKYFESDFEIKIFTDDEMDCIVKEYDTKLYTLYLRQQLIIKTDIFRIIALYTFGGYYMDLDIMWNISPLSYFYKINGNKVILCDEKTYLQQHKSFYTNDETLRSLSNYFIASQKNAPFISNIINALYSTLHEEASVEYISHIGAYIYKLGDKILNNARISNDTEPIKKFASVLMIAGPLLISHLYNTLNKSEKVDIYVIDHNEDDCIGIYAKHLFGCNWYNSNIKNTPSVKPDNSHLFTIPKSLGGSSSFELKDTSAYQMNFQHVYDTTYKVLNLPQHYKVALISASNTGAWEMAIWSLLGSNNIDIFSWDTLYNEKYITTQLGNKFKNVHTYKTQTREIPDFYKYNSDNDTCFMYNNIISGMQVPNCNWITHNRNGLVLCDATYAAFAIDIEWNKIDAIAFSWKMVLNGSEDGSVLILSPNAIKRIKTYKPSHPPPKVLYVIDGNIFHMLPYVNTLPKHSIDDYKNALDSCDKSGGVSMLINKNIENLQTIKEFVNKRTWISFLIKDPHTISNTSVCLTIDLPELKIKQMSKLLNDYNIAYDIYIPYGFRIWCGAIVNNDNIVKLLQWVDWAYSIVTDQIIKK